MNAIKLRSKKIVGLEEAEIDKNLSNHEEILEEINDQFGEAKDLQVEDEEMEEAVTSNVGTILVILSSICRLNCDISSRVMKLWRLIFLQPSTSLTSPTTTRTSHGGPWGEETGKRPLARRFNRHRWRNR